MPANETGHESGHEIIVCMGSACFARGNTSAVRAVQDYVKSRGLEDSVEISGTHCQQKCREGPNIQVDGECLCGIDPATLPALLDARLAR